MKQVISIAISISMILAACTVLPQYKDMTFDLFIDSLVGKYPKDIDNNDLKKSYIAYRVKFTHQQYDVAQAFTTWCLAQGGRVQRLKTGLFDTNYDKAMRDMQKHYAKAGSLVNAAGCQRGLSYLGAFALHNGVLENGLFNSYFFYTEDQISIISRHADALRLENATKR